jgi:glycosyltransferase involved in cell wall biosynthesis
MPVSIVMPTYNGMQFLPQAVKSVLAQHYQDWELIISDDGSKDDTRTWLAGLNDPRITVHMQPKNLGIFGNLNFLFTQARYPVTQILCQDDYFQDEHSLDRLMAEWEKLPPQIAFLRCNHDRGTANSILSAFEREVLPHWIDPARSDLYFAVFGCIPGNLTNVSVRTALVAEAGWYRPDLPYAGDFEFWSRLGRRAPWALSPVRTTVVRTHSGQASVYLNFKGELMSQMRTVLETLYRNAVATGASAFWLRVLITINYTAQHMDRGVKGVLLQRNPAYLRMVMRELGEAEFSLGRFFTWLLFFVSLGGRAFRIAAARRLFAPDERSHGWRLSQA